MKKIISIFLLSCFSLNSFAISINASELINKNQDKIEKLKELKNNSGKVKDAIKNAKSAVKIGKWFVSFKTLASLKKKGLIKGFVLIGGGAAATATIVHMNSAQHIANKLLEMTDEEINAYIAINAEVEMEKGKGNLEKINKAANILLERYDDIEKSTANNIDIENYERVFEIFEMTNSTDSFDVDSISYEKSIKEQEDLERSKEFIEIMEMFKDEIKKDPRNKSGCITALKPASRMVEKVPKIFRTENELHGVLTYGDKAEYAINQYSYFNGENENRKYEFDHIPSYKALELKFADNKTLMKWMNSKTKNKKRFDNLKNNGSSIKIKKELHKIGRTYGRANQYFSNIDKNDLEMATIKDISTLYYNAQLNKREYSLVELKKALIVIYFRNLQLCLYE